MLCRQAGRQVQQALVTLGTACVCCNAIKNTSHTFCTSIEEGTPLDRCRCSLHEFSELLCDGLQGLPLDGVVQLCAHACGCGVCRAMPQLRARVSGAVTNSVVERVLPRCVAVTTCSSTVGAVAAGTGAAGAAGSAAASAAAAAAGHAAGPASYASYGSGSRWCVSWGSKVRLELAPPLCLLGPPRELLLHGDSLLTAIT
jgi:hypothetical protein